MNINSPTYENITNISHNIDSQNAAKVLIKDFCLIFFFSTVNISMIFLHSHHAIGCIAVVVTMIKMFIYYFLVLS